MFNVFRKDLTVKRKTAGSYVNGFWVAGTDTTLTIKASVRLNPLKSGHCY